MSEPLQFRRGPRRVFGRLGRLAAIGDAIEIEGYRFQVTAVDGRRVAQVRVVRARPPRKAA